MNCLNISLLILFPILFSCSHDQAIDRSVQVKGIYGNPQPFWDKGYSLEDLGVNAVFVHSGSITGEMMNRARIENQRVYAEFATLNGKNYVDDHPEAWPVNEKGEKAPQASWFMGVCPNNKDFRQYRLQQLNDLLSTHALDGIWMDYVHWHAQFEEPDPILPETCFCPDCLTAFSASTGLSLPEGSTADKASWILGNHDDIWRTWRCEVIVDWVSMIRSEMERIRPGILLGIYHCPWEDHEFGQARRKILGLDYDLLRDKVDIFSPMVYHGRMGRDPEWVSKNIAWFSKRIRVESGEFPKIWTIVQAHDDPAEISPEAFHQVLKGGLSAGSSGVMMFTTWSVAEDPEKTRVMKSFYTGLE